MLSSLISENLAGASIDDIRDRVFCLFASCIEDPLRWRIIIELSPCACDSYYLVDFSADGVPFSDPSLKVCVSYAGDMWNGERAKRVDRSFSHYESAVAYVASLLQKGFSVAYVEGY